MKKNTLKGILGGVAGGSVILAGYYTFLKPAETEQVTKTNTKTQTTTSSSSSTNSSSATSNSSSQQSGTKTYKDGTYTGSSTKSAYGEIQLEVTISGGKITDINATKYPTRGDSKEINADAIPKYVQEAVTAQSSDIKLVSGATETFGGFTDSLQKALAEAE